VLPSPITDEVNTLKEEGYTVEVIESEGWANIVFHSYPVPPQFSKPFTDLLVKLPLSYPNGRPDMFWTDDDLAFKDGRIPRSAEQIETALGKRWRRFSWHPQNWIPGTDNLQTYLEFVNNRFAKSE
jgi:hypothetical protein